MYACVRRYAGNADFADKLEGGYSDIYHAARCHFAMSVRKTRERLRVGRALRDLPRIEKAFIDGALSYSRVREVTRVATPETEPQWLDLARQLPMRTLERRVAEAGGRPQQDARTDEPADVGWTSPETLEVRLHLRAETWALLQRAMEGARRLSESETLLSDGTASKVKAAALAAVPGGTIIRVETDSAGSPYEAHVQKADGTIVTVKIDGSFNVTRTESGLGGGRPMSADPTNA